MSRMSKVVEFALEKNHKEYFDDAGKAREFMQELSLTQDEPYKLPKMIYHTKAEIRDMFECQTVIFNDAEDTDYSIVYLHGGIYVEQIMNVHISFCNRLAKKVNGTVFAPLYPLAPNHTCEETYEILEKLYRYLLGLDRPIVVMGDSAGGGLAAAFAEYLAQIDLPQPKDLILISPWLDISMSGNYDEVEYDPLSGVPGLKEMGKAWAGDLDVKDYRVSPMYGDVSGLSKTTLFVGTHEILYVDVVKFHEKLKENGIDVELNIGEGMNHVYPVYPLVPESKEAFKHIVDVILG